MRRLIALGGVLLLTGCTGTYRERTYYYNTDKIITLYSGMGSVIKTWRSTGKVYSEEHSDGYFFRDKATGRVVTVGGTVVIETAPGQ